MAANRLAVLLIIALTVYLLPSCGDDNPTNATDEVVLFTRDTLSVYTADSLLNNGLQLYGVQQLTGNKKYGIYFTASTNDSSIYSQLRIFAQTCKEPPCTSPMITHINELITGSGINQSYGKTFLVERSDTYNLRANLSVSFDTSYHTQGKYIKLQNIKFSRFD